MVQALTFAGAGKRSASLNISWTGPWRPALVTRPLSEINHNNDTPHDREERRQWSP